jgi:hypothetical protein
MCYFIAAAQTQTGPHGDTAHRSLPMQSFSHQDIGGVAEAGGAQCTQ